MKKLSLLVIVFSVASVFLLNSCSHNPERIVANQPIWNNWGCDSGVVVSWSYEDASSQKVKLRLDASKKLYTLDKVYKTDAGTLYSNGQIAFRLTHETGWVFWATNDETIGQNCKALAAKK